MAATDTVFKLRSASGTIEHAWYPEKRGSLPSLIHRAPQKKCNGPAVFKYRTTVLSSLFRAGSNRLHTARERAIRVIIGANTGTIFEIRTTSSAFAKRVIAGYACTYSAWREWCVRIPKSDLGSLYTTARGIGCNIAMLHPGVFDDPDDVHVFVVLCDVK